MFEIITALIGLIVFEIVNSVDNAIVNAHVLKTMSLEWRRRFLVWGMFSSVFLVRFLAPLAIIWISVPFIPFEELMGSFAGSSDIGMHAVEANKHLILMFGGVFLMYLYFHWLFLEKKQPLFIERFVKEGHGVWFFAFAAAILVALMYFARHDPMLMIAAAMGSTVFFIVYGFKEKAEQEEKNIVKGGKKSDASKFLYLEALDATFSLDGVIGAFAFTTNLLMIVVGIGIGAIVVRQLTISGIQYVANYKLLKNGAMTSIGFLGVFMAVESFHIELPFYLPTLVTVGLLGLALYMSMKK